MSWQTCVGWCCTDCGCFILVAVFFIGLHCAFQSSGRVLLVAARDRCLIKGPRLKLLSATWVRHWIPNPRGECIWLAFWFLRLTGLKMRSLVSLSTKYPIEIAISVLVVCCVLLKGQGHLSWEWNALCNKNRLTETQQEHRKPPHQPKLSST